MVEAPSLPCTKVRLTMSFSESMISGADDLMSARQPNIRDRQERNIGRSLFPEVAQLRHWMMTQPSYLSVYSLQANEVPIRKNYRKQEA